MMARMVRQALGLMIVLGGCAAWGPKQDPPPQTSEQKLHGPDHLVFVNDWGRPLCSVWISQSALGDVTAKELVERRGPDSVKDAVPLPVGGQVTFDIKDGKYDFSSYTCDQMTRGSATIEVKGSMTISIGGKPHDVPPHYASGTLPMSGYLGESESASPQASCSKNFASEVDPTKCCSGKIATKDKGSHYFCAP
jgi:hypothetical protein